jgi:hypothetical protein
MIQQSAAMALALTLLGCGSGIETHRFKGTSETMLGIPYNLPMTTYKITIKPYVIAWGPKMKGMVKATIESGKTLDPDAMFTLHSSGWFATSTIKATMAPDLTNTGLNTSTTDKTGTVIGNVVSVAATVATLVAFAGAVPNVESEACNEKIIAAVNELKPLTEKVKKENDILAAATNEVTLQTAKLQALGNTAERVARKALADALDSQSKAKDALARDQQKLNNNTELTSDTEVINWPNSGSEYVGGPYQFSKEKLEKWGSINNIDDAKKQFDVYLQIARLGPPTLDTAKSPTIATIDPKKGIPVRFPIKGRLSICAGAACADTEAKHVGDNDNPILQLGPVYTVPALGGTFKSEVFNLTLDTNGVPTVVEVQDTEASAKDATDALKTAATTVAGIPAAITKAKTDAAKADADLQTALANNKTAAELAPIQAETVLAKAKLEQMKADDALDTAQTAKNTTDGEP